MEEDYMLTTVDNPWNPFTQWDQWYAFDMFKGYNTCGLMAQFSDIASDVSDEVNEKLIDQGVDRILNLFPYLYQKVYKSKAASLYDN